MLLWEAIEKEKIVNSCTLQRKNFSNCQELSLRKPACFYEDPERFRTEKLTNALPYSE